jgi:3-deoxy-D-manno-octulosonic-acid transferase
VPLLYNLLLLLASPLLAAYLAYRLVVKGKSREGFSQRLGWAPRLGAPPPGGRIWLHAVSAGEVVAAAAIARRLRETAPEAEVVISATTPAGRQQAERLVPHAAAWFYFPFDFLPCAALALSRVRPTVVAAVETEIWPNWLWLARASGARAALVNGQFADRGFRGARRFRWLYRWALGQFDALLMQTPQAAERALFLGAPPERVRVVGNVKFEQQVTVTKPEVAELVRSVLALSLHSSGTRGEAPAGDAPSQTGLSPRSWGAGGARPLWVAGSTHPGEEEQVLEAFRLARERIPELALLLAPRHVERAGEVAALLERAGLRYRRRSGEGGGTVDVLLLDTMGELAGLYALADVVFLGGSLAPIGGHDILQPLFFGKPALFGPHMHNQHDLAARALREGAARQVEDAGSLAAAVVELISQTAAREQMRAAAARLLQENTGAAAECATLLARLARGEPQTDLEPKNAQAIHAK